MTAASSPEHNYEYGAEHDGYKHVGIPPGCPACAAERRDKVHLIADKDVTFPAEATGAEPGPECVCGSELKVVPLPADLAALSGRKTIHLHVATGDTRCYPESSNPEDLAATAEPL